MIMFELDQRIAEQLSTISLNSSVQVRCGNSNAFMVTASTMLPLMQMFEMGGVYITASRGAVEIIQASNRSALMSQIFNSSTLFLQVFWEVPM